jgi:probable HAF family extracellular repeat protein
MLVTTDETGWVTLIKTINQSVKDKQFITALATDELGNTSEFSYALNMMDTDGDGLYDVWESPGGGIDVNQDGIIDLDLYKRGARYDRKDIFVEIDIMEGYGPSDNALKMVIDAFAKVPDKYINNPDGAKGINLVIEHNDIPIPYDPFLPEKPWMRFQEIKKEYFGTYEERENHPNAEYLLEAKALAYRYAIWASRFGLEGESGIAENAQGAGGNDFLITLGGFEIQKRNDDRVQAGTFMHELGHTLGLQHGGIDSINYKPNYISVMNYSWQTPHIKGEQENLNWRLDYSRQELPPLIEDQLWEAKGFGALYDHYPDSIYVPFSNIGVSDVMLAVMYPYTPVDWDGDGDVSGFASRPLDLNDLNEESKPSPGEILWGYDDWSNLKYNFRKSRDFKNIPGSLNEVNIESSANAMTPEIYNYLQSLPPYGVVPPTLVPASIVWLGTLGGNRSIAYDISDDGMVIVGIARDSSFDEMAFRWTPKTGMQNLGTIKGGYWSEAYGVSGNGKVVVGMSTDSVGTKKAIRWTEEEGMKDLGIGTRGTAHDISGDGTTIVGSAYFDGIGSRGFRYREGAPLDTIGTFGGASSMAMGVNYNGNLVVGSADNFRGDPYAFLWSSTLDAGNNMNVIGNYYSFANSIAGNGSVITGFETGTAGRYRAFRWSIRDGLELNILGDFSEGFDVSFDGEYIVGCAGDGAFRHGTDIQTEFYDIILKDILHPGTELWCLTAISSDGRFAVGNGYNSLTDRTEAFLLDTGGRLILTSIKESERFEIIPDFSLNQNYPNPFNPTTTIRYNIPIASNVKISVYNILGQQVTKLVDEYKASGTYDVRFDASRLASGIYLYTINAGAYFESRKMILIK